MRVAEKYNLSEQEVSRIIEMAWEDRTPFDAIKAQFGLSEQEVIKLMRQALKLSSWKRWRQRVKGRATKHAALSPDTGFRHKSSRQRVISLNKISKR
ncbi:MAG: TIGR03643 family protein [Cytophagales bacterium]|nr:TIGR03643 family protein [Bernardetiaceae bacterium]MDW8210392.1 TIGR03643 family protein [Cytophagales bacterium]